MAKIVTISVPKDKEHLIAEVEAMPGSASSHWVAALEEYLSKNGGPQAPFWYVPGRDYSHLPLEVRKDLMQFGYTDKDLA